MFEIKGASIRRLCQWLSGMINILSLNELSPVLMRFSSPRYQRLEDVEKKSSQEQGGEKRNVENSISSNVTAAGPNVSFVDDTLTG